ncbi:hypothetical protein [Sphingomonas sp. S-NIH.Pt15_0812]|uniref:hypothetical protein n=1 Tax=Sphingomonas sp. S-NIH.Pt15_0812 TaxID=1920129 RepID=UPI000F7E4443|nr:hypothetical protein [Sphingomonas sp. S-NIH.Pt15_0812]RSU47542.1 hypothetical protein BRX43_13995 [Sphingomonas sp. S-NIH.Pt15_0812]
MKTDTTRRALLGGAGLATAALIAPAIAATRSTPVRPSPAFAALIAANAAAEKACKDYQAGVYSPLIDAVRAEMGSLPHTTTVIRGKTYSTAVEADVNFVRAIVKGTARLPAAKEHCQPHRTFTAAAIRRQRASQRIWNASAAPAACEESDRLVYAWGDAQGAVVEYPVNTAADLHAKLSFMAANQMEAEDGWFPYLVADAARIAQMGGR